MDSKQWIKFINEADERTNDTKGHMFETILKTRCRWCRRTPNVKTTCGHWFATYLSNLEMILLENKIINNK